MKAEKEIAKQVDDLANALIEKFYTHYKEVCEYENAILDQTKVFEAGLFKKLPDFN